MDFERDTGLREMLRDLGWLPSDLQCDEKRRLAEEYLAATKEWSEIGRGLRRSMLENLRQAYAASKYLSAVQEYQALVPSMEEARQKAAQARLALEAHIAGHRC